MSEAAANQAKVQDHGPQTVEDLIELIRAYAPNADFDYIRKAYAFSEKAHSGQIRRSGDPYILHPLGVAAHRLVGRRLDGRAGSGKWGVGSHGAQSYTGEFTFLPHLPTLAKTTLCSASFR